MSWRSNPTHAVRRVVLDRTAFYPTSGGQPFDTGLLGDARVVDVLDDDETGRVVHVVEAPGPAIGSRVTGTIDASRRHDHRQQHTGQHILSAAFDHLFGVRTESFHLGRDASTIDLARDVTRAEIDRAETLANDVVWSNRPVSIRFVDEAEAAALPLRKAPVRGGRLRLIDVTEFDLSACGGTHVAHTGEVGQISVDGWERYKGGARISFVCGGRALAVFRAHRDAVTGAVRVLSVLPHELPDGIARLQTQLKDTEKRVRDLQFELASYQGAALAATLPRRLAAAPASSPSSMGYDAATLKPLASAACSHGAPSRIVSTRERPALVACARQCRRGVRLWCAREVALRAVRGTRGRTARVRAGRRPGRIGRRPAGVHPRRVAVGARRVRPASHRPHSSSAEAGIDATSSSR